MKEYKITPVQCMEMVGDNVCPGCGGKLVPIETVDNAGNPTFWAACETCSTFQWGVPKIVQIIASKLVIEGGHVEYTHLGPSYDLEGNSLAQWQRSQIAGTTGLVSKVIKFYNEIQIAATKIPSHD